MFDCVEMIEAGRKWAGADVGTCTEPELLEAAVALETLISLASVASAHVLAELDALDVCDATYGMRTVPWVASAAGVAPGQVRSRLRVGRALRRHFGVLDDAVCEGSGAESVSFDHARALAQVTNPRVTDVLSGIQHEIVALAGACGFERFKADLAAVVELADVDGAEPVDVAGNSATVSVGLDGVCHLDARFDPDTGPGVRSAIEAKADELFHRFSADNGLSADVEVPGRATLRALALAELVRQGLGAHDAGSAPRAELTLVMLGSEITDDEGRPLGEPSARMASCDPDLWAVVVDSLGEPLGVGHAKRLATLAQRRAIAVRDGGCVFPGCDAPIAWTDTHHVRHWLDGGPTDLANLAALCRHHHGVTHRKGWSMHVSDDQWFWWRTPSGDTFWGQRHHRRRTGPTPQPGEDDTG